MTAKGICFLLKQPIDATFGEYIGLEARGRLAILFV